MMMKAEIASEMIRSRTQTPSPVPICAGTVDPGSEPAPAIAVDVTVWPDELGSESVPDMLSYCIQNRSSCQWIACDLRLGTTADASSSRTSSLLRRMVTITAREDIPRTSNEAPSISEQNRVPQPDPGVPLPGHSDHVGPVGLAAGRRRRPGLQRRTSTQRDEAASPPDQGRPLGSRRPESLPDPRLRARCEAPKRASPATLLLLRSE